MLGLNQIIKVYGERISDVKNERRAKSDVFKECGGKIRCRKCRVAEY